MKIAIYSPYLDSFGGGERYMMTIAECLADRNEVDILLDNHLFGFGQEFLKNNLSKRLNLNLSKAKFIKAPIGKGGNFLKRLKFLRSYDYLFYLTDGSIFYSTAKNNILHFQVPFENKINKGVWGRKKLNSWKMAIYNSKFTKELIEKTWNLNGKVIYPPVGVEDFKPLKKQNLILSVGRFVSFLKTKKHELMIDVFKKMKVKGWSLHLAGGLEGDKKYLDELKKRSKGVDIFFYPNVSFEKLQDLYGRASIYWHAMGFGEKDPHKQEHFGITTVEAMAAGAVPVVINSGGQPEIVEDGKSGYLWNDIVELKKLTLQLINDPDLIKKLSQNAILRSKIFSKDKFCKEIREVINGVN